MGLILCEISSPSWRRIEEDRELVLCCVCPGLWLGILRDTLASSKCDSSLLYTQPFCSDICPGALVGRKKVVVLLREGGREGEPSHLCLALPHALCLTTALCGHCCPPPSDSWPEKPL